MGQALYRKHRPKSLEEVIGQEHITQTLKQAIKQGRISHAYLLTGPRGVGKTSVARILAHEINDLPYTDDSTHMDIIEIDAASNRRIDEIRELRDKVYVAPTSAKYKVYIIDEVHMLTREAFNALLKTLEEPPAHVVFILATTDAHKLPETIISRTQRFSFRPVDSAKVVDHLKQIAKSEKIDIDDDALQLLASHGEGSFRDSISLLDQASSQGSHIGILEVENQLGTPSSEAITHLISLIATGSTPSPLMKALSAMYDQGYQASEIAKRLGQSLRAQLVDNILTISQNESLKLLGRLIEVPASHDPEQSLEIALLRTLTFDESPVVVHKTIEKPAIKPVIVSSEPIKPIESITVEPSAKPKPVEIDAPETSNPIDTISVMKPEPPKIKQPITKDSDAVKEFNAEIWPDILKSLKQKHNTLYGVVRMAQPDFSQTDHLKLAFAFSFHQKRLSESANRQKIVDIIYALTGHSVDIECVVDKAAKPPKITVEAETTKMLPAELPAENDISAISNIFGKAELLES